MKHVITALLMVGLVVGVSACKKSKEDLQAMCDKMDGKACYELGDREAKADNKAEAKDGFRKACENGNVDGCYELAIIEEKAGNFDRARDLFNKTCDGKKNEGCLALERMAKKGK